MEPDSSEFARTGNDLNCERSARTVALPKPIPAIVDVLILAFSPIAPPSRRQGDLNIWWKRWGKKEDEDVYSCGDGFLEIHLLHVPPDD